MPVKHPRGFLLGRSPRSDTSAPGLISRQYDFTASWIDIDTVSYSVLVLDCAQSTASNSSENRRFPFFSKGQDPVIKRLRISNATDRLGTTIRPSRDRILVQIGHHPPDSLGSVRSQTPLPTQLGGNKAQVKRHTEIPPKSIPKTGWGCGGPKLRCI